MQCEKCVESEATIHLSEVISGTVKKVHLCEACAIQMGLDVEGSMSITDVLSDLGKEVGKMLGGSSEGIVCPKCQMDQGDFKKGGRLGCADCYVAFGGHLKSLVKSMHRSVQHRGKVPEGESKRVMLLDEMNGLESALSQAIRSEHFEEAAGIRDALKKLRLELEAEKSESVHEG